MLSHKTDLKHVQHSQESLSKRARVLMIDSSQSNGTTISTINASSSMSSWPPNTMKTYENSPGKQANRLDFFFCCHLNTTF